MRLTIDLNADLGEGAPYDREMLAIVSSASISCGVHAGDPATIRETLQAAKAHGVAVGAHPSFWDREHFGRRETTIEPGDIGDLVSYQLGAFLALCHRAEVPCRHVKPHGALYNLAARDRKVAEAIVKTTVSANRDLAMMAPAGSELARAARAENLRVIHEVFADRNYQSDGTLVARSQPNALLHEPEVAAERMIQLLASGKLTSVDGNPIALEADTICLHGDQPRAVEFARSLRAHLSAAGIRVAAPFE